MGPVAWSQVSGPFISFPLMTDTTQHPLRWHGVDTTPWRLYNILSELECAVSAIK